MRVEKLKLESFGHFEGYDLDLKPGINLLFGRNEAGKSTVLAFVRAVLFGFESSRSPGGGYEPRSGKMLAGELWLETSAGRLTLRRERRKNHKVAGELRVTNGQGAEMSPEVLSRAMAGISKELFYQVFAFGLSELMSFEALTATGTAAEALFAAGMEGAQRLPEAVALLDARTEEVFKPNGSKALNARFERLKQVRVELESLGDRPREYFDDRLRLQFFEEQARHAEASIKKVQEEKARLQRLCDAAVDLFEWRAAREELKGLPDLSRFPAEALSRLDELGQRLAVARQELEAAVEVQEKAEAQVKERAPEAGALEKEARIQQAVGLFQSRREAVQAFDGRWAEFLSRQRQCEQDIRALGLRGDLEAFRRLDLGASARAQLAQWATAFGQGENQLASLKENERQASSRRASLEAEHEALETEAASLPREALETVELRQNAVELLERGSEERQRLEEGTRAKRSALEKLKTGGEPVPAPVFPRAVFFWAAGASLGLGAWAFWTEGWLLAVSVTAGLWGLVFFFSRHAARQQRGFEASLHAREESRKQEGLLLERELGEASLKISKLEAELSQWSTAAQLPPGAGLSSLVEKKSELRRLRRDVERRHALEEERKALLLKLAEARAQEAWVASEMAAQGKALGEVQASLASWLVQRGFPEGLSLQQASETCAAAIRCQEKLFALDAESSQRLEDKKKVEEVRSLLREACRELGGAVDESAPPELWARTLENWLQKLSTQRAEQNEMKARLGEMEKQTALCRKRVLAHETEWAALLESGGASDSESFRKEAERAQAYEHARRRLATHESRAQAALGALPLEEAYETIMAAGGKDSVEGQVRQLEANAERLGARQTEGATERGRIQQKLSEWEKDGRASMLRSEEELLRANIGKTAAGYLTDRLAFGLLRQARRRMEKESQPRVMERASHLFQTLTDGRYVRVYSPFDGKKTLRILDASGREWSAEELSRGTREQLYLSFRLAVIEDFGESKVPLPIFLDDILVNFDPERVKRTLTALGPLAKRHQIIAFTCHPSQREAFEGSDAAVHEL